VKNVKCSRVLLNVDFCIECDEYPCSDLKKFQSERPHRAELWDDLKEIKAMDYKHWLKKIRTNYACPQCQTIIPRTI